MPIDKNVLVAEISSAFKDVELEEGIGLSEGNAKNTFAVTDTRKFKHVVLIDDAVGSGATMNQIAGKIKNKKLAQKVTGLAIVGSLKGFDVITDV